MKLFLVYKHESPLLQEFTLYLQPTQDLTIDTQVSRTQYQFTLQSNLAR